MVKEARSGGDDGDIMCVQTNDCVVDRAWAHGPMSTQVQVRYWSEPNGRDLWAVGHVVADRGFDFVVRYGTGLESEVYIPHQDVKEWGFIR